MKIGTQIVVTVRYDGNHGRAFKGDRGVVARTSIGRLRTADFGYDHGFHIELERGFEMFIPNGCFRPMRTLELLAECAE